MNSREVSIVMTGTEHMVKTRFIIINSNRINNNYINNKIFVQEQNPWNEKHEINRKKSIEVTSGDLVSPIIKGKRKYHVPTSRRFPI